MMSESLITRLSNQHTQLQNIKQYLHLLNSDTLVSSFVSDDLDLRIDILDLSATNKSKVNSKEQKEKTLANIWVLSTVEIAPTDNS